MAQWRALELDVLLTPMMGPALDLNGPGKATGEAGSPITSLSPVSSLLSSALCLVRLLGSRRRGALGEDSTPDRRAVWLAGEKGVRWYALGGNELSIIKDDKAQPTEPSMRDGGVILTFSILRVCLFHHLLKCPSFRLTAW